MHGRRGHGLAPAPPMPARKGLPIAGGATATAGGLTVLAWLRRRALGSRYRPRRRVTGPRASRGAEPCGRVLGETMCDHFRVYLAAVWALDARQLRSGTGGTRAPAARPSIPADTAWHPPGWHSRRRPRRDPKRLRGRGGHGGWHCKPRDPHAARRRAVTASREASRDPAGDCPQRPGDRGGSRSCMRHCGPSRGNFCGEWCLFGAGLVIAQRVSTLAG